MVLVTGPLQPVGPKGLNTARMGAVSVEDEEQRRLPRAELLQRSLEISQRQSREVVSSRHKRRRAIGVGPDVSESEGL